MRLSLTIPVYNEQDCIADCLEHVSRQIRPFDEVIVVDNNSADATREIVESFEDKLPLTVLDESKQGMMYARNTGYDAATGDVLCKIDADTRISRSWSQGVASVLESHPEVVGVHGYTVPYDIAPASGKKFEAIKDSLRLPAGPSGAIIGNNMAIRRSGWVAAKPHLLGTPDVHEDGDTYFALQKAGQGPVWWSPKLLAGESARRLRASTWSQMRYVAATVRTFRRHGEPKRAAFLAATFPLVLLNFRVNWLIAMAYDPETGANKWSRILSGESHDASPI